MAQHPVLNIAVRAARSAGDTIMRYADRIDTLTISEKSRNDFVSEVDHQAERAIIDVIHNAYPDHAILAEESGSTPGNDHLWIIDPLDGTTNYLHQFPQYAVSIALQIKGRLEHAVVYDPNSQELFTASRGSGAQLNGHRIRVTNKPNLHGALLGTGFRVKGEHLDCYLNTLKALIPDTAGVRRPGSAALDLAYLAAGRIDGFWEIGLRPWDVAGGVLLIQEAGGMVGDFGGGEDFMKTGNIVAGNPKVFAQIVRTIQPHLIDSLKR